MRIPLRFKIVGSFALIVLSSLVLVVFTGNRITRSRYDDYAVERDLARAGSMAEILGPPVAEALEKGTPPVLPPGFAFAPPPRVSSAIGDSHRDTMSRMMGSRMMDRGMTERMAAMDNPGIDRILVTDSAGKVLIDTAGFGRKVLVPGTCTGAELSHGGSVVGYLYLGRMIPEFRPPMEISFFRRAGRETWVIASLVFVFAMLLGLLLSRHITVPVKVLSTALSKVGDGQLTVRVAGERRDELGDLNRGFNNMTASLESSDRQRRRLIADSAHELRTPVSLIRTRIEMMEEGIYPMDRDALKALSAEAVRLTRLVDELKTLANLESPDFTLDKQPVNIVSLMEEVAAGAEPEIRRKGLSVRIQDRSGKRVVPGDRDTLVCLISNLLSNAIRYSRETILLTAETREDIEGVTGLKMTVEDDGPGIPPEERLRVFQRYYRIDASRTRENGGSGLGLAICEGIVRSHGGRILAESSESLGGACLTVLI
jgi:signal transduction histidine kinase